MIEALGVTVRAGGATLLHEVSLAARAGELLAVVGPNGSGKSTLLRVLAGELSPTAGSVELCGKPLGLFSRRDQARARAFARQESDVAFSFSAGDVVLLGRTPHTAGLETARDRAIAGLALRATRSVHLAPRLFPSLSGGEKQRVSLSRSLCQIWEAEPDAPVRALLLDEPTASLDPAHQHAAIGEARRLARQGCAVVAVLHDLNLAAQYSDRIAVLRRGALRALGPPREVLTVELLASVFSLEAVVALHPTLDVPLVVPLSASFDPRPESPLHDDPA